MTSAPDPAVTITDPMSYTEAIHSVHGARVADNAPLIDSSSSDGDASYVRPETVTVTYAWRGQLGHTWWHIGNIQVTGPWVTADGATDQRYSSAPRTALILSLANAPDWAASFARVHLPAHLSLTHTVAVPLAVEGRTESLVAVTDVTRDTEVRHVVHGAEVTGADIVPMPSRDHGPIRWMRPTYINTRYLLRLGPLDPAGWSVCEVSVTGPWVTADGEPDTTPPGNARAAFQSPQPWLTQFLVTHTPVIEVIDATAAPGPSAPV